MSQFPSEGFVRFASLPRADRSGTLLRALADIYAAEPDHRRGDRHLFEELFLSLYSDAAEPDRAAVAALLADRPDLPPAVAAAIGFDVAAVAAGFVTRSRAILPVDLVRIAWRGEPAVRKALAGRSDLDRPVLAVLLVDPDPEVLAALLDNTAVALEPEDLGEIRRAGAGHSAVLKRIAARAHAAAAPKPAATAPKPAATAPRSAASAFLDLDEQARWAALGAVAAEAALKQVETRGRVEAGPAAAGGGARLFDLVVLGDRPALAAALAEALALDADVARRIAEDPTGEPLAVALAALSIDPTTATSVLLLTRPAEAATFGRMKRLSEIHETLGWRAARLLVEAWRGAPLPTAAETMRQLDASERREAKPRPAHRHNERTEKDARRA